MVELNTNIKINFEPGTVWLVGAGPGDIGLLTLYAFYALQEADIIIYDALVNDEILNFANPKAEKFYAGKRGGRPSPKQDDITQRIIAEAQKNKRVLRLKGGDPFVFGRGGEEALQLVKSNIIFHVVPGVTSAIAALSYAGIPLTHRTTNSAALFLTGHSLTGDVPEDFNWQAIHQASPVLVFYMAIKHAPVIADNLLKAGRTPDEAVAIISHATTKHMRVFTGTLQELPALAKQAKAPSIIAIGPIVHLREHLQWWDT